MSSLLRTSLLFCLTVVNGRLIETRLDIEDPARESLETELDPFKITSQPSASPTVTASDRPSMFPSNFPSESPSQSPSSEPSVSNSPTAVPVPVHKGQGYFNYDPNDPHHGLRAWPHIHDTTDYKTWADWRRYPWKVWEFETNNQCGYGNRQSPIDVCDGIGDGDDIGKAQGMVNVNTECNEYHRIHTQGKDWKLDDPHKITMEIFPSKLRIKYALRDCDYQRNFVRGGGSPVWFPLPAEKGGTGEWCNYEPPCADYPHHWNGFVQVVHADLKFPSEHTICGKRYDGEFIIYHAHPQRQSVMTMNILIQIGTHNFEMQKVINAWEHKFNENKFKCQRHRHRQLREQNSFQRRMSNVLKTGIDHEHVTSAAAAEEDETNNDMDRTDFSTWADLPDDADKWIDEEERRFLELHQRRTQGNIHFNPYHDEIYRSKWFYGYWGSLTEPPCLGRFVTLRVMDAPMEISQAQYNKLTHMLFHNVDHTCLRTSADFNGSVARPTQPFNNRSLWRCNRERWESSFESWRCDENSGTQYGCVREGQTMIKPVPEW